MWSKEIENYFFEYISRSSINSIENDTEAMIFGRDSFNVDVLAKSLYVLPLDIFFKDIEGDLEKVDWIVVKSEKNSMTKFNLCLGFGEPYHDVSNNGISTFTEGSKVMIATPYTLLKGKKKDSKVSHLRLVK